MVRKRVGWWLAGLAAVLVITGGFAAAQTSAPPAAPEESAPVEAEPAAPEVPEDALGRGTPRGCVAGFFEAAEAGEYERASDYLDLRYLPRAYRNSAPSDLARGLNIVLQRALWVDVAALSDSPEGMPGDGLPAFREEFGRITLDDHETVLLLERIPRTDGELIWVISRATVAHGLDLHSEFGYGPTIEAIAEMFPEVSFLGVELFKWAIGLGAAIVLYPILFVLGWLIARLISKRDGPLYPKIRRFLTGPIAVLLAVTTGGLIILELGIGQTGQRVARAQTLTIIISVWLIFSLVGLLAEIIGQRMRHKGRDSSVMLLRPVVTTIKGIVLLAAALIWLDNIGFNITTLLAGLGVGGLAVALALQKPLEDMFGALTLFTQQMVRVSDFCRFGDRVGTVEEIGLRTTRIRTLEDTVVSLPNARFAAEYIENVTLREKIRYHTMIRLRLDTTPPQLKQTLEKTRELLSSHADVIPESGRVRFKELGEYAHIIEAHAYVATTEYVEYLRIAEELNLDVVKIVEDAGAKFALPLPRPS